MEKWNIEGAPTLGTLPTPSPLKPQAFAEKAQKAQVLDTRMEVAFGGAHVPSALSIWAGGLASFAGWFLSYDKPLLLVSDDDPTPLVRTLIRLGYDRIEGYLAGGMLSWHMAGKKSQSIRTITTHDLCQQIDEGKDAWILDVRSDEELEAEGEIADAHHIHITQVPQRTADIPQDRPIYIFCGSGMRSMTAASFLQHVGWDNLTVILGGVMGWHSTTCPLESLT
jgi:hydroxyacylglutathione hydrolase